MSSALWDLVVTHAERAPSARAVAGERTFSYQEVVEQAASLAARLKPLARAGDLLALAATTPSLGAIAMLAAASAGCAVLPLNTDSPARHRAAVLADARPSLVLSELDDGIEVNELDDAGRGGRPPRGQDMRDIAYVLYTSGSTGRPKGVVVSREALLARLAGLAEMPGFDRDDSILAMTSLSFDISMAEMLVPLYVGGCLVSAPPDARLDPSAFARVVRGNSPAVIQATPSFWHLALAWGWEGAKGSRVWCGGEALTTSLARRLLPLCAELWNLYGPTEATIWACAWRVTNTDTISLGQPLPGTGLCLAAADGGVTATPGNPGEILLYGAGLAEGYLDRPEMTAERFRVLQTPDGPTRCYRTGDRAQYAGSGALEFLGRTDGQVKLRGHRIELGEVERVLEEHPSVQQAVAVLVDPQVPQRAHLAAFVVTRTTLTPREIRRWLADRLPSAIRPQRIEVVPSLPRTAAGKADRVQLAAHMARATQPPER